MVKSVGSIPEHQASSSSPTGSKRRHDEAETSQRKRLKTFEADLQKKALHAAKVVQGSLQDLDYAAFKEVLIAWRFATNKAISETAFDRSLLESRLLVPERATKPLLDVIKNANDDYATFCDLQGKVMDALPSPSYFARPDVWPVAQAKHGAILCLRPVEKRGLPLSTLHDVFRKFRTRLNAPFLRGLLQVQLFHGQRNLTTFSEVLFVRIRGNQAKDNAKVAAFLLHGAPMFLMCLLGPIIFVAGGFYDGSSAIVEPLAQPCFMLIDETDRREQELARLLYAVDQGLEELKCMSRNRPPADFLPGVPRLYSSCVLFTQPAMAGWCPTAYIMEYLGSDWMSLFEFERKADISTSQDTATLKNAIWTALEKILTFMAEEDIVHGDLRSNNIMLQVNEETKPVLLEAGARANLKVIDFDWAEKAGQVFYPTRRNEDIKIWPACSGSSIDVGHDRQLVDSWWPTFLAARSGWA
ncbi:hypothetical protein A0H81_02391 [Grifola frondosa]|uniref:Uncharacterized protein n=1 Tax=Grifola frondosa TaxID=5627 RepID=A0A1C7MP38_GRIFR|nr:hypothetical protein A0H81_02391 [Grifola frondosa]